MTKRSSDGQSTVSTASVNSVDNTSTSQLHLSAPTLSAGMPTTMTQPSVPSLSLNMFGVNICPMAPLPAFAHRSQHAGPPPLIQCTAPVPS